MRRREANEEVRLRLDENPLWIQVAGARQLGQVFHPDNARLEELLLWAVVATNAAADGAEKQILSVEEHDFARDEIIRLLRALDTEDDEEIRCLRFFSTPHDLYREMLSAVLFREPQEVASKKWLRQRLNIAKRQVDPDDEDEKFPEFQGPETVPGWTRPPWFEIAERTCDRDSTCGGSSS